MEKNLKKIYAAIALFLLVGVSFFYLKQKLDAEAFRDFFVSTVEKTLKNSSVKVGSFEVSAGLNVVAKLNEVDFSVKNKKESFLHINRMIFKISLYSLFRESGHVKIELENVNADKGVGNVLSLISSKNSQMDPLTLPGFFRNSTADIKIQKLKIIEGNNNKTIKINFPLITFKNLNFNSSTAYEIKSNVEFFEKNEKMGSFDSFIIGQLSLSDYIQTHGLKTFSVARFSNIHSTKLDFKYPEVKGKLNVNLASTGILTGDFKFDFNDSNFIEAKYYLMENGVRLENLNSKILTSDLLSFFKIDKNFKSEEKQWFTLKGDYEVLKSGKSNGLIGFDSGILIFNNSLDEYIGLSGTILNGVLSSQLSFEGRGGSANLSVKDFSLIDLSNKAKVIDINVEGGNFNFSHGAFAHLKDVNFTEGLKSMFGLSLNLRSSFDLRKVKIGESSYDFISDMRLKDKSFIIEKLYLTHKGGKANLYYSAKEKEDKMSHFVKGNFSNLNLNFSNIFLPPEVVVKSGRLNGKLRMSFFPFNGIIRGKFNDLKIERPGENPWPWTDLNKIYKNSPLKLEKYKDLFSDIGSGTLSLGANKDRLNINYAKFKVLRNNMSCSFKGHANLTDSSKSKIYMDIKEKSGRIKRFLKSKKIKTTLKLKISDSKFPWEFDEKYLLESLSIRDKK